jgi:hypothetical protein
VSPGVQVFVYPEELEHVSADALAAQVLEIGCDAVSISVVYHRARRVFPRHRRVSVLARNRVYIAPDLDRYGTIRPTGTAMPSLLRFREACDRHGVRFRAWVVALHDEQLALDHPAFASQLLDGSPSGHGLCPSAPEVVEYVAALAADVAAQLGPETIDLEAAFYPAWEPSYTLTLALEPVSERARLLGAQCFCTSCSAVAHLAERTRAAAGPPFGEGREDDGVVAELARFRAAGASRLVAAVADAVHRQGSLLRVFASGAPQQARLQGVSEQALAPADALLFGCGPLQGDELQTRFAGLRGLAGRTGTASMNWTPERSARALAADARQLAASGAEGLALYNLSLVPDAGLDAFRAAAAAFRAAA